ncbi:hypothetical protein [Deefgea sp. CFH1-16]|uniref:hypothetical protein n=1 Tax=Deefgea sp. CFH1-16 TaxID=2675457 RepID=UPI001940331A|nr:hypothetical protein [Deefgea sp. CFH1-16]
MIHVTQSQNFQLNLCIKYYGLPTIQIVQHKKKLKVVLGVLIDDLGLQCGAEVCDISSPLANVESIEPEKLPNELENVLAQYSIVKRDKLLLQGERNCKNRGLQALRKIIANSMHLYPELSIEETSGLKKIIFKNEQGQKITLAESKMKDIWTAKCPLIMAQHYKDTYQKISKLNPHTNAFHIIDFSETEDYNKVITGTEVGLKLFLQREQTNHSLVKISNVFLSDFDHENYILKTMSNFEMDLSEIF